ncbi:MAG: tetratricopeptide repeat-containing sensor histidine kinase [Bacteroidetes bacterium]|nr:tetratricopeptide repeat-containing sensor histidine kinase [Bacteroidota bacterium]
MKQTNYVAAVATALILLLALPVQALATKADSLIGALQKHGTNDTARTNLLIALANSYRYNDPDAQYLYGLQALHASEKQKYPLGKVAALETIATSYFERSKYDSSALYNRLALDAARQHHLREQECVIFTNLGNISFRTSRYFEAMNYYDSSLSMAEATGNKDMKAKTLANIASVHYQMGNYADALKLYLEDLKTQEPLTAKPGVWADIAGDYSNISNVYYRLGDYKNSLAYANKALSINKKVNSQTGILNNYTAYALVFDAQKNYDSALHYLEMAEEVAVKIKDEFAANIINGNIAEVYVKTGAYDKAYPLYEQSMKVAEKLQDMEGVFIAKAGIGNILVHQGNIEKGIVYLKDAMILMQQLGLKEQVLDVAEKLTDAYEKAGDYKHALYYSNIRHAYRDSIARNRSSKDAQQLLFNYELQKKQDHINLLQKNEASEKSKEKVKTFLLFTFGIAAILALVAAYLFFRNLKNTKKSRQILELQKQEIEYVVTRLREMNDFKDRTFSVLAHDLRSPVNALSSTMMMLDEKLITPEEFIAHRTELNNKLQSVTLMLDNMLQWAKTQMKGEQPLVKELIDIHNKISNTIAMLKDAANQKSITLSMDVREGITAYADKNQVQMVIRNLISNAIKFTPENGMVSVTAKQLPGSTHIYITDNGIGMDAAQVNKLFNSDNHASTEGTMGERGTGLGLKLSYDYIKMNGGDIMVSSQKGQGTTFIIMLPGHSD